MPGLLLLFLGRDGPALKWDIPGPRLRRRALATDAATVSQPTGGHNTCDRTVLRTANAKVGNDRLGKRIGNCHWAFSNP